MDIVFLIKDLFRKRNIEQWFDAQMRGRIEHLFDKSIFEGVITKEGVIFPIDKNFIFVFQVYEDYKWDQIRKDDIVIDIGANMGGFTANAAKRYKKVLAVEPIATDILIKTIALNHFDNVTVLEAGLGDGSTIEAEWVGKKKTVPTYTLSQMKAMIGGCDVLKCDCEGYEWFIRPEELEGIKNIQMEIHAYNPSQNEKQSLLNYLKENYECKYRPRGNKGTGLLLAVKK